ncbi:MAG TPA: phospho-sugar mutase, partial [Bacteroidales bacterium]|nr:phospho-sugar mutase [Bacteroidales bacterium]
MNTMIDQDTLKRAQTWLEGSFDEDTKQKVKDLIDHNPAELTDAFYRDLEFGTGGLRGIMGVGTNRMNKYTVGMATQGLANYLKKMFPEIHPIKMAISFDSRNNSRDFARICSEVLSSNGFTVYLFEDLRPTPELSFAIRDLHCQSGIMITASHNPSEYNGYKAYWDDGAQMIAPHDENVIDEVKKIASVDDVKWNGIPENIHSIGKETDEKYLAKVLGLSLSPEAIQQHKDLKIVYTPLHGCGRELVPEILKRFGFTNVAVIKEQAIADGNFPTVRSPNPEEPDAMSMAIAKARELDADLVMATDPDADRVGIALKNHHGEFVLLNGNQTAALLFYYILKRWQEKGKINGRQFIVSTIVTSSILHEIGNKFGVEYFECLTGFKFIADVIRKNEEKKEYIVGGEESFGYLIGDFVRDKDAVSACAMIAEAAAWSASQGQSLYDLLISIYQELGLYKEQLLSITKKGKSGAEEIRQMMVDYRQQPPKEINHSAVIRIMDYLTLEDKDLVNNTMRHIDLPLSDVLQFYLQDGSRISVRPS